MECEELYDVLDNSRPSEQELPLEDFGDCELKSKPYVGMQFDSLDDVETFYKELHSPEPIQELCTKIVVWAGLFILHCSIAEYVWLSTNQKYTIESNSYKV